jgi:predicted ferric reductase
VKKVITQASMSCQLSDHLGISWEGDSAAGGVELVATMASDTAWSSVGFISDESMSMVPSSGPKHTVFLHRPVSGAALFVINGYSASSFTLDSTQRYNTLVLSSGTRNGSSQMKVRRSKDTGVASDPLLATSNRILWAHGGDWPTKHSSAGVTRVYWAAGVCDLEQQPIISPYWIFSVPVILITIHGFVRIFKRKICFVSDEILRFVRSEFVTTLFVVVLHLACVLFITISTAVGKISNGMSRSRAFTASLGVFVTMNLWLTLFPRTKLKFWQELTGIPLQRLGKYHIICSVLAVLGALAHLVSQRDSLATVIRDPSTPHGAGSVIPMWGFLSFLALMVISTFSLFPHFRQFSYRHFLMVHQLYVPVIIFAILHKRDIWPGFVPGLSLRAIELLSTSFARLYNSPCSKVIVSKLEDGRRIVTVTIRCPFLHYLGPCNLDRGGEYFYLNCSRISLFQWHPFSVCWSTIGTRCSSSRAISPEKYESSDEHQAEASCLLRFHILTGKDHSWTSKLADLASEENTQVYVALNGPFGGLPTIHLRGYSSLVFVVGGIGITYVINMIQRIVSSDRYPFLVSVHVAWSVRGLGLLRVLADDIRHLLDANCHANSQRPKVEFGFVIYDSSSAPAPTAEKGLDTSLRYAFHDSAICYRNGRIDLAAELQGLDPAHELVYTCGPPGLTASTKSVCNKLHLACHIEHFSTL